MPNKRREAISHLVDPAACAPREMLRGRGSILPLVSPNLGAVAVSVQLVTIRPGSASGPVHFHTATENVLYVLGGKAHVQVGEREFHAEPGQLIFIPPKAVHSVSNGSATMLNLLEIYAPADPDFVLVTGGDPRLPDQAK